MTTNINTKHDGAAVIAEYLIAEKVPYVFGVCGHGNIGFLDALHARQDQIKTISVHHESVAGFMADVYYRVSGQPTATFTSCGDRKSTRLNSSHVSESRMPSSA